jgi:hypothetical protein
VRDLASVGGVEGLALGWLGIMYGQRTMPTLPNDGDWTETCRRCFNVNFNILLKQLYCASVGK